MPPQERTQNTTIAFPNVAISSKGNSDQDGDDDRLHLAQRIVSSRSFGRSKLLREFLLYVCTRHAQGRASELTEHQIGIRVFGRCHGYNSNDDNIVRNYARTLRKRLEEYFATEGKHEELRLDIPRGGYIPVFYSHFPENQMQQRACLAEASSAPFIESALPQESSSSLYVSPTSMPKEGGLQEQSAPSRKPLLKRRTFPHRGLAFLLAIPVCLLVGAAMMATHSLPKIWGGNGATTQESHFTALWGQLFQKDRDTFVVAADSGLVIMQEISGRRVSLDDYASGKYRSTASFESKLSDAEITELGTRRYTSIVDLEFVFRLSRLREVNPERILLRYSRDVHMENLRSGNAILLGSADSNPWASLFEQQLDFRFSFDPKKRAAPVIVNQHPLVGEQPIYTNDYDGPWHKTYGTISWLPNLDATGHVLLVGGIDMAGTQAAGSFVLNSSLMNPILDRARAPDGSIRSFEILIESNNIAANASRPHAVIERIGH